MMSKVFRQSVFYPITNGGNRQLNPQFAVTTQKNNDCRFKTQNCDDKFGNVETSKESADRKFLRHLRIISESQNDCNSPVFCLVGNEHPMKIR